MKIKALFYNINNNISFKFIIIIFFTRITNNIPVHVQFFPSLLFPITTEIFFNIWKHLLCFWAFSWFFPWKNGSRWLWWNLYRATSFFDTRGFFHETNRLFTNRVSMINKVVLKGTSWRKVPRRCIRMRHCLPVYRSRDCGKEQEPGSKNRTKI